MKLSIPADGTALDMVHNQELRPGGYTAFRLEPDHHLKPFDILLHYGNTYTGLESLDITYLGLYHLGHWNYYSLAQRWVVQRLAPNRALAEVAFVHLPLDDDGRVDRVREHAVCHD
jgi:hypothetical protein